MRCTHCGAMIPDDQVVCPECGAEVQIVPDYNPLDDVLAREVKGSVEGATRQIQTDDIRRYRRDDRTKNVNSTRVLSREEMDADQGQEAFRRTKDIRNCIGPRHRMILQQTATGDTAELRGQTPRYRRLVRTGRDRIRMTETAEQKHPIAAAAAGEEA